MSCARPPIDPDLTAAGSLHHLLADRLTEYAVILADPDGRVSGWNPGAEMLGRSIFTLVPPEQHDEARRVMELVRAGERVPPYEAVRFRKDGSQVPVSVNVWPVWDPAGTFLSLAAVYTDLTERRRTTA